MIEEAYVSFETAKLLKEKGFDEVCWYFYSSINTDPKRYGVVPYKNSEIGRDFICCPTHQLVVRWLREHYAILITPTHLMNQPLNAGWSADITVYRKELELQKCYDSYEDAVDAAIQYSLENLI